MGTRLAQKNRVEFEERNVLLHGIKNLRRTRGKCKSNSLIPECSGLRLAVAAWKVIVLVRASWLSGAAKVQQLSVGRVESNRQENTYERRGEKGRKRKIIGTV